MIYTVQYKDTDGETKTEQIVGCSNPGAAFAECLKRHKGCKLLRAQVERRWLGTENWIEYEPPEVQREPLRPLRLSKPKRNDKEGTMPFYDEVVRK